LDAGADIAAEEAPGSEECAKRPVWGDCAAVGRVEDFEGADSDERGEKRRRERSGGDFVGRVPKAEQDGREQRPAATP
jgi:hypothetical protein